MDEPRCLDGTPDHLWVVEDETEAFVEERCAICALGRFTWRREGGNTVRYGRNQTARDKRREPPAMDFALGGVPVPETARERATAARMRGGR